MSSEATSDAGGQVPTTSPQVSLLATSDSHPHLPLTRENTPSTAGSVKQRAESKPARSSIVAMDASVPHPLAMATSDSPTGSQPTKLNGSIRTAQEIKREEGIIAERPKYTIAKSSAGKVFLHIYIYIYIVYIEFRFGKCASSRIVSSQPTSPQLDGYHLAFEATKASKHRQPNQPQPNQPTEPTIDWLIECCTELHCVNFTSF
jgi:hypothetical protein